MFANRVLASHVLGPVRERGLVLTQNDGELFLVWALAGLLIAVSVWAGLWSAYGLWAAIFGWIPAAIIGAIGGFLIALFWRAILGIVVLIVAGAVLYSLLVGGA